MYCLRSATLFFVKNPRVGSTFSWRRFVRQRIADNANKSGELSAQRRSPIQAGAQFRSESPKKKILQDSCWLHPLKQIEVGANTGRNHNGCTRTLPLKKVSLSLQVLVSPCRKRDNTEKHRMNVTGKGNKHPQSHCVNGMCLYKIFLLTLRLYMYKHNRGKIATGS